MDDNYGDALARAKQLAAKYSSQSTANSNTNGSSSGMKRSSNDDGDDYPQPHKRAYNEKIAQAAEAAARLNQKLGGGSSNSTFSPHDYNRSSGGSSSNQPTIVHKVPDHLVGLIIGKKGEQITRIQRESGCNVQIAPDSGGKPERDVTLTGTNEQIDTVKQMITEILEKANPGYSSGGGGGGGSSSSGGGGGSGGGFSGGSQNLHHVDIGIPGPKAGLIIGKNGETIKQLQEQAGVKMVLIQDSNAPTEFDKPLRITGEPAKVERAKQMVIDLLNSRLSLTSSGFSSTTGSGGGGGGGGGSSYGSSGKPSTTFAVPSEKAGLVIGKGGETVKEIMRQSGAHVEIQRQPSPNPTIKIFNITGDQTQVDYAIRLICEKASIPPPAQSAYGTSPQYGTAAAATAAYGQGAWAAQQAAYSAAQWSQPTAAAAAAATAMPAPVVNPQTGQPDYTAAWVEYYRRQGLHAQADAILRQSQAAQQGQSPAQTSSQSAATSQSQPTSSSAATAAPGTAGYDYSQQWSQYAQWQQWQQQQQYASGAAAAGASSGGWPTQTQQPTSGSAASGGGGGGQRSS